MLLPPLMLLVSSALVYICSMFSISKHGIMTISGCTVINDKIGCGKFIVRRIHVGSPVKSALSKYAGGPWRVYVRKLMSIRVVTYNIGGGNSSFSIDRITAALKTINADLVCLQEVSGESVYKTQAHTLASRLRMNCVFGSTQRSAVFGNAILSRWPLHSMHPIQLPRGSSSRDKHRAALAVMVSPFQHRPRYDFWCVCTQLGAFNSKDQASGACTKPLQCIRDFVQHPTRKDMPALLLADLNAIPGGATLGFLEKNWNVYSQYDTCFTTLKQNVLTTSKEKLDHILDRSRDRWVAGKQWVEPNALSDSGHIPLIGEFHIIPE